MFGYATWFGRLPPLPIAQVVWSDGQGRLPWEEGADADGSRQPSLWIPADQHPLGPWSGMLADVPWAFRERPDSTAFTTKRVFRGAAIAYVFHDREGTWQFVDAEPWVPDDFVVSHLGHIIEQEPSLAELADLPIGWGASRDGPEGPWIRRPTSPESEGADGERRRRRWPWTRS
jgi:hypothetical protein